MAAEVAHGSCTDVPPARRSKRAAAQTTKEKARTGNGSGFVLCVLQTIAAEYCVFTQYSCLPPKPKLYNPRHPERTLLYQTVAEHYETWLELASAGQFDGQGDHHTPKPFVRKAFAKYLECGIFAHGFARARCDDCGHDYFVAFSCKGRGVCPSCTTRRMVETAAPLTITCSPACRCASGCCRCPSGCGTSCSATGWCSIWCCASSCG
jgi:hypothetical protein